MEENRERITNDATNSHPILSVIVPVYNAEKYLDECINSILNQTFNNFELILVDDGSKDNSAEICDTYAKNDQRVKVLHKVNGGASSARNAGLAKANGIYISYVDADDWFDLNAYENLMKIVTKENADILVCGYVEENPDSKILRYNKSATGVYRGKKIEDLLKNVLYTGNFYEAGIIPALWNKIFRKEILVKNQFQVSEDIVMGEDAIVTYSSVLEAECIVISNESCYYHYRILPASMAHRFNMQIFKDANLLYTDMSKIFGDKRNYAMLEQLDYYICYILLLGISRVLSRKCQGGFYKRYKIIKDVVNKSFVSEIIERIDFNKVDKYTARKLQRLYKKRIILYMFEEAISKIVKKIC